MALKFRRGTTAQQSGSLVFGEPYVNTTLGTLIVGGPTGDIILSTSGTGSTGNFGAISGSGLDITGNANIAGNLTLGGNITIGDATTDNVVINADLSSSLIPNNDNAFTIGSAALRYSNIYGVNIIGSISATNGVVSGSSQITATSTTGFSTGVKTQLDANTVVSGSSQVIGILASLNTFSGSQLTQNSSLATITGSLISTASANTVSIANLNTLTASALTRFTNLETTTASLNTSITNLNTFSASENGKSATLATYTASVDGRFTTLATVTGSLNTSVSNINTFTSSQLTQNSSLATITGSLILTASNLTQRVAANEAVSGTFARTNSANIFNGTQTITGSLYVSQDLVVAGSSSIQNISSSNLVIGTAYVTLNTNTPSSRYAGLRIVDSGSSGGSGSFLYDAEQDEFIFVHRGNGLNVTSSHFVLGPQTYDNLGNETYLTNNRLSKGTGVEHIVDSQISDDGTTVTIPGALTVTGNITGPIRATNGIVSGSSQVVGSSITTNTITIGSTSTALGGTSTSLAGLTSVTSTGFTGSLTGNASTATTLQTARLINGTSFNGSADITIANLVSGSSQVIGILSSLNSYTASNDTTNTTQNTSITNLNTYTSSFAAASVTLTNKTIAAGSNTISGLTNANLSGTAGITNANLANSSVTVTAGTGLSGGGSVSLGGSVTVSNAGVTSFNTRTGAVTLAATDISLLGAGIFSGSSQIPSTSITNAQLANSSVTVTAGTGLSGGGAVALGSSVTLSNAGVTSITSNTGLSSNVSATGAVTITNTGVTSNVAGTGISVSGATGAVTITNSGVTSAVAGTGVSVSGATGAVTISIGQSVATTATPTFGNLTINGTITATGDITAYFTSDKRHKNNIQTISNAVLKVKQLNGVTWEWNDDVSDVTKSTPKTGLIAQEVQQVLPQVVIERGDGFLALDYSKMVGLLVEAIKEQQIQIDQLKAQIGSK